MPTTVIENNTLPGLTPDFSDLCVYLQRCGYPIYRSKPGNSTSGCIRYGFLSLEPGTRNTVCRFHRETEQVLRTLQQIDKTLKNN
jgi:hypothetical protein